MIEIKVNKNKQKFKQALGKVSFRFPVAEISEKTGYGKSQVSKYLNEKADISDEFLNKFLEAYNLSLDDFKEGDVVSEPTAVYSKEVVKEGITGIYYPNVSAVAGLDSLENSEFEKIPITIPLWGKGLTFINVFGESMYPKFISGEIIAIKEIQLDLINYGYAYVVVLTDGEVYLKYIQKGKDEEHLLLKSENEKYEPRELHIKYLKRVYIVKGVITKTTM